MKPLLANAACAARLSSLAVLQFGWFFFPVPRPPSAGQLSFEWARRPEKRKPPEHMRLDAIHGCSVELAAALDLANGFANLIRKQSCTTWAEWLARGETSSDPDLRRFAEGIRRDEASV
jgi:hypothetical protein